MVKGLERALTCLVVLVLQYLEYANADFEQTCTFSDYFGGRTNVRKLNICGQSLTEFVIYKCGGVPYFGSDIDFSSIRRKRDIILSKNEANSYLRTKRSFNTGIVCECCIHDCSVSEFDQYCQYTRRRRRSADSSDTVEVPQSQFIEEEIIQVYRDIDQKSETTPGDHTITSKDYRKMQYIETNKRDNIERKFAKLLNINTDGSSEVSQASEDVTLPVIPTVEATGSRQQGHKKPLRTSEILANSMKGMHIRHSKHRREEILT